MATLVDSVDLDPFVRRMAHAVEIGPEEVDALLALTRDRLRSFALREDILREGDHPTVLNLVMSGWAARVKMLEDGRRQILSLLLPGDLCDLNNHLLGEMDHSLTALTPCIVAQLPHAHVHRLMDSYPRIARAFWWHSLTVVSMQREWTLNVGQRSAMERLGTLFCELFRRLEVVGLTHDGACEFPITQLDLAEATGLTAVHVNRTLQEMRASGLIALKNRQLTIPNFDRLAAASLFTPTYLHLDRTHPNTWQPIPSRAKTWP